MLVFEGVLGLVDIMKLKGDVKGDIGSKATYQLNKSQIFSNNRT